MHIKQVIVEGFKTYREQTAADFEPHLNNTAQMSHAAVIDQNINLTGMA